MRKLFITLIFIVILGTGCTNKQYTEINSKNVSLYIFPAHVINDIEYVSKVNPGTKKIETIKIYVNKQLSKECSNTNECKLVTPFKDDVSSYYSIVYFHDKTFAQTKEQTIASYFRDVKRIYDLRQYNVALRFYLDNNKTYPTGDGLKLGSDNFICLNKTGWGKSGCLEPLMGIAPKDPSVDRAYVYYGSGDNYKIEVNLEGIVDVKEAYGFTGKIEMNSTGLQQSNINN